MSPKKLGRYDLIRVLGKGAMGLVYEGRDPNLDRRVAIKTIKVENLSEESAAEYEVRFRTEAHSAARLQHPNIVSVYDSDRDGDIAFLVMEFIQGEDLKHHLDNGALYTLEQTVRIMEDLLSALDYAHRQGIVHRDIKPANLLIEPGGCIKLTDFGVARIQDSGEATRTQGTIVGTLKYMSPEQLQGQPIDARADLFGAAVVLYQLLTGKRPFDGDTDFAVIQQIVGHNPEAPTFINPKLPPAIDAVVARSLSKVREQRYSTAREFSAALKAACRDASDSSVVPPPSLPRKGSNATWSATLRPGESLMNTQPGGVSVGSGGINPSIVTQEIELVYWKDVKDSDDLEDIHGFLAKFPSGVYADLARRRIRKLGAYTGDESDIGFRPGAALQAATVSPGQFDKTMVSPATRPQAREGEGQQAAVREPPAPASQAAPPPAASGWTPVLRAARGPRRTDDQDATRQSVSVRSVVQPEPVVVKRTRLPSLAAPAMPGSLVAYGLRPVVWALAGVTVVAAAWIALKFPAASGPSPSAVQTVALTQPAAPPVAAAAIAAAVAPANPAAQVAVLQSAPSIPPPAVAASASAPAPAAAPALPAAKAPVAAVAPVAPALAAASAAAAKKALAEREKPTRQIQAKPLFPETGAYPTVAAPAAPPSPVERMAASTVSASNPRQACEDRMLLAFQMCLAEQCAKPAFARHPVCSERRAMDQRRREAEQMSR
jgi:eukaryotic-like serine/threonine-protein kinase